MSVEQVAFFILALVIVTVWLYVATMIVTRETEVTAGYALRLVITAILTLLITPVLRYAAGALYIPELAPIVAFVGLVFIVKKLIAEEVGGVDDWQESLFITFLLLVFIYVFDALLSYFDLGYIVPQL